MPVPVTSFVRSDSATDPDVAAVARIVTDLRAELESLETQINEAHVFNAQSTKVQDIVAHALERVGFSEEVVLTPQEGFVTRARPDFYLSLGVGRGVIAEVERGGTVTNNHDLKDFWKAHIGADIQHLVLVVPNANVNQANVPRERPYARVVHRLRAFFGDPRREVDVRSCHVVGYGMDGFAPATARVDLSHPATTVADVDASSMDNQVSSTPRV